MKQVLSAKIHRAVVTGANVDYEGSISISNEYLQLSGIHEYERVLIADINNGNRFETYVIAVDTPKTICLNGAAAHLVNLKDKIIIMSYDYLNPEELQNHKPKIVLVDEDNNIISVH